MYMQVPKGDLGEVLADKWIPGCYGMRRPVVCFTADIILLDKRFTGTHVLVTTRGKCNWGQTGRPMISVGGFVDLTDLTAVDGAVREIHEEVPGMQFEIDPRPLTVVGPLKLGYRWDPGRMEALPTGELCQDVPIATAVYLAIHVSGDAEHSTEALDPRWRNFSEVVGEETVWAFNHALVLQHLVEHLRRGGEIDF